MAEFACQCGKTLENGKNGDALYVFLEKEVLAAHQQVPGIPLADFIVGWRRWALRDNPNVIYWHCPDCGKVYESAPVRDGEVYRVFERTDREDQVVLSALATWERVFVLTSEDIAKFEAEAGNVTLFDAIYATRWERDYFLHPEEKMVLALKAATNESAFIYEDVDKKV